MLYYHTLYTGLDDLPPADPENRARIEARLATVGSAGSLSFLAASHHQCACCNEKENLFHVMCEE